MKKFCKLLSLALLALGVGSPGLAQLPQQVGPDFLKTVRHLHPSLSIVKNFGYDIPSSSSGIPGVDSIVNFTSQFDANGIGLSGQPQNVWYYSMVGNEPQKGGATFIGAPIIPVSLKLLAADGSVALRYDVTPYIFPTLWSPVFFPAQFSGSPFPTQFTDAVQRAEFFGSMRQDWHTLLLPELKKTVTMTLPFGTYIAQPNADGSCCLFVLVDYGTFLNLMFPGATVDNSTLIGAAELSGEMTTKEITTFLFPNTYLFLNGDPNDCCVLGFHGPDIEPGTPSNGNLLRLYMMNYASYISPGLFGPGFQDVTALSHEMAETFNDPFVAFDNVHNVTPWWLSGDQCQDVMEVGDVIESLPANVTFPVKTLFGTTYNVQNVALLPWFEFQTHSTALHGAYSYPNAAALPALSPFENPGCQ